MSDLKELLSGISPQHAQNYPISKCALCDFSLIISHLLGTLARLHKKKSLYNPEYWDIEVTLATSVIALSLPDFNAHI